MTDSKEPIVSMSPEQCRSLCVEQIREIELRVRPTIAPTFGMREGKPLETVEGRIACADFEALMNFLRMAFPELRGEVADA